MLGHGEIPGTVVLKNSGNPGSVVAHGPRFPGGVVVSFQLLSMGGGARIFTGTALRANVKNIWALWAPFQIKKRQHLMKSLDERWMAYRWWRAYEAIEHGRGISVSLHSLLYSGGNRGCAARAARLSSPLPFNVTETTNVRYHISAEMYLNPYRAGIDFRRHNLTSVDSDSDVKCPYLVYTEIFQRCAD